MKYVRWGGIVFLIGFLAIQLIPYGHQHTNPSVLSTPHWDSVQTQGMFERSCGDCHSNETVWPWYSNIAPVSWMVQHDVEEGREKFNVSVPNVGEEAGEAAETVERNEMPPATYVWLHNTASLNAEERQLLEQGLRATFGAEDHEESEGAGVLPSVVIGTTDTP